MAKEEQLQTAQKAAEAAEAFALKKSEDYAAKILPLAAERGEDFLLNQAEGVVVIAALKSWERAAYEILKLADLEPDENLKKQYAEKAYRFLQRADFLYNAHVSKDGNPFFAKLKDILDAYDPKETMLIALVNQLGEDLGEAQAYLVAEVKTAKGAVAEEAYQKTQSELDRDALSKKIEETLARVRETTKGREASSQRTAELLAEVEARRKASQDPDRDFLLDDSILNPVVAKEKEPGRLPPEDLAGVNEDSMQTQGRRGSAEKTESTLEATSEVLPQMQAPEKLSLWQRFVRFVKRIVAKLTGKEIERPEQKTRQIEPEFHSPLSELGQSDRAREKLLEQGAQFDSDKSTSTKEGFPETQAPEKTDDGPPRLS